MNNEELIKSRLLFSKRFLSEKREENSMSARVRSPTAIIWRFEHWTITTISWKDNLNYTEKVTDHHAIIPTGSVKNADIARCSSGTANHSARIRITMQRYAWPCSRTARLIIIWSFRCQRKKRRSRRNRKRRSSINRRRQLSAFLINNGEKIFVLRNMMGIRFSALCFVEGSEQCIPAPFDKHLRM